MAKIFVLDGRTENTYAVPITNNSINATDFAKMTVGGQKSGAGGLRIIDPGLRNTAVLKSSITRLDEAKGQIWYRDYNIEDLMEMCDFEDAAYLLIWGHLPDHDEKIEFINSVAESLEPPRIVLDVVQAFPRSAPCSTIMTAALSAWSSAFPDNLPYHRGKLLYTQKQPQMIERGISRTLAAFAAVIALTSCHRRGVEFTPADKKQGLAYNILLMDGKIDPLTRQPDPDQVGILNKAMLLYADHEMTNSTTAFMHVASTQADPISSTIAAVQACYGPLHGGAIDVAYKQLRAIGDLENIPKFLEKVKAKETRVFGFGNRVWKAVDPRFKFVEAMLESETIQLLSHDNQPALVAFEIERQTAQDAYFINNRIRPNVDLLGCFVFSALGFDKDMAIAIAASARMAGVMAHWKEQLEQPINIWRPRSVFVPQEEMKMADGSSSHRPELRARL